MVVPDIDPEETVGLGCALEYFSESAEVLRMIDELPRVYCEPTTFEAECDRLYTILKQYYEQPHLLDPHLETILSRFIKIVRDRSSNDRLRHAVFHYMYQIIRVRGYKIVVRYLPHEVTDFEEVLTFLEAQDPTDMVTWRSKFVLLLWLSILVIIPFDMKRLDGFKPGQLNDDGTEKKTVMERVLNICKTYAFSKDACMQAGAFLTSKFLVRSDVKELYMKEYFAWACELHSNLKDEGSIRYGVLASVAAVLKHGKREDLLPHVGRLLKWVTDQNYKDHNAILVRKYGVKIVQRIGCTYLKPRVVSWRYTQGFRSLADNLTARSRLPVNPVTPAPTKDEDIDIPQEVEDVVELLLCGLRDDDTVVRWSAAKGLGRVSARLPADAAAEVCESVLGIFTPGERETAWHGGCMALAELGRCCHTYDE